jgi:hypothetical protein
MITIQEIIKLPLVDAQSFNSFTAKFANGTYHIYHDLWDNHDLPLLNTQIHNTISVDYTRAGFASGTFNQEAGLLLLQS